MACLLAAAISSSLETVCFAQAASSKGQSPAGRVQISDEFVEVLGGKYRLPGPADCKAVVLLFLGHDCPISNSYTQEIGRICGDYMPQNVAFCVVYADADLSADDARRHAKEYGFRCPAVVDPEMKLALQTGATVKPEAVVLSPDGDVLYRGRIDDRYVDFGKRRAQVTRQELRDAIAAVLAGKPVAAPRAEAIGCDIDLPKKTP
ncbi:MAG TPA: hypothetical protein VGE52_15520 [Pirellulales bacterium]